jgi:hypothetical protein
MDTMRWKPGDIVVWRKVEDGSVEWAVPHRIVQDEADLVAMYLPVGAELVYPEGPRHGPRGRNLDRERWDGRLATRTWHSFPVLKLYRPGDAHSVWMFRSEGELLAWYVNFEEPWRRCHVGFESRDHMVDLVVTPDLGSWEWKDLDEYEWWKSARAIPETQVEAIEREREAVLGRLERGDWPTEWSSWTPPEDWTVPGLPDGWDRT